jgi:hypothetical protein
MGVNIHCVAQTKVDGSWTTLELEPDHHLFSPCYRNTAMFDLLAGAGMRIGSPASPFGEPRGLPVDDPSLQEEFPLSYVYDLPEEDRYLVDDQYASWLLSEELLNFNYDTPVENRTRCEPPRTLENGTFMSGGYAEPYPVGQGWMTTWRKYIGPDEVERLLASLRELGPPSQIRLVFDFSW